MTVHVFGLDGVEDWPDYCALSASLAAFLSGFPVAFAIGGAGVISFAIIAALDSAGLLIHQAIDTSSQVYRDLVNSGSSPTHVVFPISRLPRMAEAVFPSGWEVGA